MAMDLLKRATGGLASLSFVVWLGGCAQPPVDRLEQTQQLMSAARAAEAPEYTMEEWSQLEVAFDRAKEELANQEKILAIFRSYAKADDMLKRVAQDAATVGALAAEKRTEMKASAETTEREARSALASAQELLLGIPPGWNRAATRNIGHELTALKDSLSSVHRLIEGGRFASARIQAQTLKEKAAAAADTLHKVGGTRSTMRKAGSRITAGMPGPS